MVNTKQEGQQTCESVDCNFGEQKNSWTGISLLHNMNENDDRELNGDKKQGREIFEDLGNKKMLTVVSNKFQCVPTAECE